MAREVFLVGLCIACVACHAFDRSGANGEALSNVPGLKTGTVNVPSVFNALTGEFRGRPL